MNKWLIRLNPAVSKRWLLIIAGIMWSAVGIMLIKYAVGWLAALVLVSALAWGAAGAVFAFIVYRFGFSHIAHKNIRRIQANPAQVCIFGFQEWKGYGMIVLMMALGILLRTSPLPRELLSLIYNTIGGALLLSSLQYYQHFARASARIPAEPAEKA
jgi:hypothetical protein